MKPFIAYGNFEGILLENRREVGLVLDVAKLYESTNLVTYVEENSDCILRARAERAHPSNNEYSTFDYDLVVPPEFLYELISCLARATKLNKITAERKSIDNALAKVMLDGYWKECGVNN